MKNLGQLACSMSSDRFQNINDSDVLCSLSKHACFNDSQVITYIKHQPTHLSSSLSLLRLSSFTHIHANHLVMNAIACVAPNCITPLKTFKLQANILLLLMSHPIKPIQLIHCCEHFSQHSLTASLFGWPS